MKKNDKITVITCAAAFALNVALFSVKLYVGLCANSISIYSDAVNNMFDSLSGPAFPAKSYYLPPSGGTLSSWPTASR